MGASSKVLAFSVLLILSRTCPLPVAAPVPQASAEAAADTVDLPLWTTMTVAVRLPEASVPAVAMVLTATVIGALVATTTNAATAPLPGAPSTTMAHPVVATTTPTAGTILQRTLTPMAVRTIALLLVTTLLLPVMEDTLHVRAIRPETLSPAAAVAAVTDEMPSLDTRNDKR